MKKVVVFVAFSLLFASFAVSQTLETVKKDNPKYSVVEENLLVGLENENLGLKTSCAYWLGEMKSENAVIPLMKVFRSDDDQRVQLMAALSLAKIEDSRGIYLVKRVGEFTEDARMKRICEQLYVGYLLNQRKGTIEVEDIYKATLDEAEKFVMASLSKK
ncbi:MAG: HEAT repeat domain-containing protein [Rhodothermaceae bacterium]